MWIGSEKVPFSYLGMTKSKWDLLEELSSSCGYWKRTLMFIRSIANRKLSSLSKSQRKWLDEIIFSLDEELEKKAWRL